ncbi:MAG: hypothetical protein EKK51_18805 [Mycolicibacterium sp.]|uniref:hypothetical protein n=1 Tax=Mycolicibacterium sp. TaxID=2320850 RepID=UPI000F979DD9|nr:hypothetical protein [Mycolicibacterium sp.]RUP29750.1 MAG: hypothetical protein EKK51_18805 [Mycolicibacterium sp.]
MVTETLSVYRGDTDKYGNADKQLNGTIQGVVSWGQYARNGEKMRAESASVSVELFVKRGTDLKPRDRVVRADGQVFMVVGGSMWDQLHPMTGFDFGWTAYRLDAVTG